MFEAEIPCKSFKEFLATPASLVEEAIIEISEEGLKLICTDKAQVGMALNEIDRNSFDEFSYSGQKDSIGVELSKLLEIASLGEEESTLSIEYQEKIQKMIFTVENLEYTMALINADSIFVMDEMPSFSDDAVIELPTTTLDKVVNSVDMISNTAEVTVSDSDFNITSSDDDDDSDVVNFGDKEERINPGSKGEINNCVSKFSVDYLTRVAESIEAEDVELRLKDDSPIRIKHDFSHCEGSSNVLIAPRINVNT